jgi:putative membrane protein
MISRQLCGKFATYAGVVLLTCATALAQVNPGGAPQPQQQQQTNPSANSTMGGNPDAMQQQQQGSVASAMQDKEFVRSALQGGMAEVQLGQLAAEKGSSDDVKQFGQKMVADHTRLGDQMKVVAAELGVKAPDGPSKKDKELYTKLQGLSGKDFDNAYIVAMVKDHKKDADEFKSQLQSSQNPMVQQVAQQGSQVIDQHLQMIDQIAQNHNLMNSKGKLTASLK